jgi:catechol 2,3-dioxygenase-like lactoylglutathione lyase family enzyme
MAMIERLDHLVLTVADIARTVAFYERVLGMLHETFGQGRSALVFGQQKFNLYQQGRELEPKAKHPTPWAIDVCLISNGSMAAIIQHLSE